MRENQTLPDRWGYPVRTTSAECLAAINSYYHEVLAYGRNREVIVEAAGRDPECVLGNVLAAHFVFKRRRGEAEMFRAKAEERMMDATEYEKAVFKAVSCLLVDDVDASAAVQSHSELLKKFPRDLVSLKRVQLLCFYMGKPDLSLSLVEQVLPDNRDGSYIYGMLAFPLLELGRMRDAEDAAKKGLEINKQDVWSQHAICHVYQNDCHFEEAVNFMKGCSFSWISCSSFMNTHNWWHVAVCYLEGHSPLEKVLEVYDNCIMKEVERDDADVAEVYLNALGLLLRVFVRDQFNKIEDRLKGLAIFFKNESSWHEEWLLDLLALWALAVTKEDEADKLLRSIKSRVDKVCKEKQQCMQRGILLAEAMYEYGKGDYKAVFDLLGSDFDARDYKMIGASDEQLDVFNEVWCVSLLKAGLASKAIEEIEKRIKKREGVPFLWCLLEKGYSMGGLPAAAAAAEKAKVLEKAYF